jgi:hypothetical protein
VSEQNPSSSSSSILGRVAFSKQRLNKFEQHVKVLMSQASMFLASQKFTANEMTVGGVNPHSSSSQQQQQQQQQQPRQALISQPQQTIDDFPQSRNNTNSRRNSTGYPVVKPSTSSTTTTSSYGPKASSSDRRGPSPSLQQHADRFDALSSKLNRSLEERDRIVQSLPKPDEFSLSLLDGGDSMINNTSAISTSSSHYRGSRLANTSTINDSNAAAAAYAALISQRSLATRTILQESIRDHHNISGASTTDRELLDSVFSTSELAVGAISSIALASSEIGGTGGNGGFRHLSSPPAPVRLRDRKSVV